MKQDYYDVIHDLSIHLVIGIPLLLQKNGNYVSLLRYCLAKWFFVVIFKEEMMRVEQQNPTVLYQAILYYVILLNASSSHQIILIFRL